MEVAPVLQTESDSIAGRLRRRKEGTRLQTVDEQGPEQQPESRRRKRGLDEGEYSRSNEELEPPTRRRRL